MAAASAPSRCRGASPRRSRKPVRRLPFPSGSSGSTASTCWSMATTSPSSRSIHAPARRSTSSTRRRRMRCCGIGTFRPRVASCRRARPRVKAPPPGPRRSSMPRQPLRYRLRCDGRIGSPTCRHRVRSSRRGRRSARFSRTGPMPLRRKPSCTRVAPLCAAVSRRPAARPLEFRRSTMPQGDDSTLRPSVNWLAAMLVDALVADAAALRIGVSRSAAGARIVDAGIAHPGGIEAGRRIAEICLGGLGRVVLAPADAGAVTTTAIGVHAADPVLACLGSQYAGWSLQEGKFFALASGPGRARARKEELFEQLGYRDDADRASFVLEVDRPPPDALIDRVAEACGVLPTSLTFILTPTTSLAGTVQIVARSLEVALHKAHALKFPLAHIVDGVGTAPLPP